MPILPERVMKRLLVVCATLAAALPAAAQTSTAPAAGSSRGLKIAYVNADQVLHATPGYATAESTFTREVAGYREEVQKMQASLDSAVNLLDQQALALSPAAKQQKQRDLQGMQQRLQQRTEELNQRAQQRQQELIAPIQQKIRTIIDAIRLEAGYSLILNSDPNTTGGLVLSADPTLDITPKVLARIQQLPAQSQ
jgi:outer membrane protein